MEKHFNAKKQKSKIQIHIHFLSGEMAAKI